MRILNQLKRCDSGAVYVEFLIAFFPVFVLFLGTVQLAFVRAAQLVVREAAARACRSAIVILDDDPTRHSTARGMLDGAPADAGFLSRIHSSFGLGEPTTQGDQGSRYAAIRASGYVPLAALSPPVEWLIGTLGAETRSLHQAVATNWARFALGYGLYNRTAAIITLRDSAGSDDLAAEPIAPDANVTVHVTYLYYCAVPLVSRLICETLPNLLGGAATSALERLRQDPTRIEEVLEQMQGGVEQGRRLARELGRAEMPALLAPLLLCSGTFAVLEAEMTLPNQGARYHGGYREWSAR